MNSLLIFVFNLLIIGCLAKIKGFEGVRFQHGQTQYRNLNSGRDTTTADKY